MNKNRFNDDAARWRTGRAIVGGLILSAFFFGLLGAGLVAIDKRAAQQAVVAHVQR